MPELKKQPSCSLVNEWINISYQVTKETNASQWKKSIWKDYTLYDSESESCSVMSDSLQLHGLYSPWNSQGQNTGVGNFLFPSPEDLPNPGIEPRFPAMQADSLPTELWGILTTWYSGQSKTRETVKRLGVKGKGGMDRWNTEDF